MCSFAKLHFFDDKNAALLHFFDDKNAELLHFFDDKTVLMVADGTMNKGACADSYMLKLQDIVMRESAMGRLADVFFHAYSPVSFFTPYNFIFFVFSTNICK